MTPAEFKAALKSLGLTQRQAAPLLGYSAQSHLSSVANGKNPRSLEEGSATVRLLRAYQAGYKPEDWPG